MREGNAMIYGLRGSTWGVRNDNDGPLPQVQLLLKSIEDLPPVAH